MANLRMYNNIKANLSSDANLKGNITVGSVNLTGADMTNYYDKEEVDGLLENKSDVGHDHIVKNGVFELSLQEAYDDLNKRKTTELQVNTLIYNYAAPIDHDHYIKTGLITYNLQEAYEHLNQYKMSELQVNDKIVNYAAPIEHDHDDRYANSVVLQAKLNGKANKEHTHEEYAVKKTIEYKDTTPEQLEISEDTSVIRMNIQQDTTIVLPTNLEFSDAHEITLFLNIAEEAVVSFDNVALWQNEPVLEVGTVCELIFTWSGSEWLGGCIVYGTQL